VEDPFPRPGASSHSDDRQPTADPLAAELIERVDPNAARLAIAGIAVRTPTIACEELAERAGTAVALKAECLQRAGSFKVRGALAKVAALGDRAAGGLVTGSAGNHALAVAQAARARRLARGCARRGRDKSAEWSG